MADGSVRWKERVEVYDEKQSGKIKTDDFGVLG